MLCMDCQQPIEYGRGWSGVCPPCRGKRSAKVIREKREKHGPGYFDKRKEMRG